jgi:phosphoesterase RecJ-like protein
VLAHADSPPVPSDLRFLMDAGEEISQELPGDVGERVLIAVDCATELRMWNTPIHEAARVVVNIDHHQDNTRFGHLNLIEPRASSTAEVIFGVLEQAGWELTREVADPLYVGLVTDTGRFGYSNTSPRTHQVAGAMIAAGVDPAAMSRRLYEEQPLDRLKLMGKALERSQALAGGRMLAAVLTRADFDAAGGADTEGIVEVMRGVRGMRAAALVSEAGPAGMYRVSLRTADPDVDVSAIAREEGGGGHRAAAGFSTARAPEELLGWLDSQMSARLDANGADG